MEKKEFLESIVSDSSICLFNKLIRLNYDDLPLSDFQRYRFKQISFENIQKFSFLLKLALNNRENNFRDVVLVHYGGGAGLMLPIAPFYIIFASMNEATLGP